MRYNVTFTLGGCVTVNVDSKDAAKDFVEQMSGDELWNYAQDGFEIQTVEEVTE